MDSLYHYGSDDDRSQSQRSSYNAASDWQNEQDVNYEPVTMDMSEDSNEEEYYARKYGRYSDVAAAASRRNFDPYEDDVSDAPTSPEPDPPTGSHARAPSNDPTHENATPTNQSRAFGRGEESERNTATNQTQGHGRREDSEVTRRYGSYYERAKRKLSGDEVEDTADGDERKAQNGKSASTTSRSGGFPAFKTTDSNRRERHDKDRSHHHQHDERRSRDRSHERGDHKSSSSRHGSSRHRGEDADRRERDKDRRDKDRRRKHNSRSRSRSRDKYERKSSRRHKSRSRSRSRSSSKSRSHHSSSSSRHRHGSSSSRRDRRSRESSIGDIPRPYAPYERKPNKLQILEKLGIELKVPHTTAPGDTPQVIAVPSAKALGVTSQAGSTPIPSLLGISTINPLTGAVSNPSAGLLGAAPGSLTPQDLLQKTIAAQVEKIKADTGIELPKYYNPMAINPTKYAEQIQKRRLLWGNKASNPTTTTTSATPSISNITTPAPPADSAPSTVGFDSAPPPAKAGSGTIWQGATFSGDQDGRMTSKFQRLMGIKNTPGGTAGTASPAASSASQPPVSRKSAGGHDVIRNQEEMFNSMESQYEAARMATHTHRGLGLGFGTFAPR